MLLAPAISEARLQRDCPRSIEVGQALDFQPSAECLVMGRNSAHRMHALSTSIHRGNSKAIHGQFVMTSNSTSAQAYPAKAIHRGRTAVRSTIVLVDTMNTPAILMAKIFKNDPPNCRAT